MSEGNRKERGDSRFTGTPPIPEPVTPSGIAIPKVVTEEMMKEYSLDTAGRVPFYQGNFPRWLPRPPMDHPPVLRIWLGGRY